MTTPPTHIAEALKAVEFAMEVIRPDTRTQARRLHAGFLTARTIDTHTIEAHWDAIADRWPQD